MKHTEIAFILDRSGSMESMTHAAISGFNEFLKAQQATVDDHGQPIPATFTLILFDHEYPDSPELDMVWVAFADDIRPIRQVSAAWLETL